MADGKMMTHAAGSEVNMDLLAGIASDLGAGAEIVLAIRAANTARHVLELCGKEGLSGLPGAICRRVAEHGGKHAGFAVDVRVHLVDFDGTELGRYPAQGTECPTS
jgi:cobalt-precorrin-5B (C1)-methyltransferase